MDENGLPGGAFILQDGKAPIRVRRESFPSEADFQELIAQNPQLLSGDLLNPEEPIRWLLIDREVAIGDSEDSGGRWTVDHIFVDQHGTPTLVEVKRRSDSRLKRDVVGQVFNYVAFAAAFLSGGALRRLLEARFDGDAEETDQIVRDFIGEESSPERFWQEVGQRLKSGNVRAMIVADEIPFELRRVLEFMNEKMDDVEFLGLELQLYSTAGYRTLVPRLVGRTAQAEDRRSGTSRRSWTMEEVLERFPTDGVFDVRNAVQSLLDWAESEKEVIVETGTGGVYPSIRFRLIGPGGPVTFLVIGPDKKNELWASLYFGSLQGGIPAFADEQARRIVAEKIHETIDGNFDPGRIEKYPSFFVRTAEVSEEVRTLMQEIVTIARIERSGV